MLAQANTAPQAVLACSAARPRRRRPRTLSPPRPPLAASLGGSLEPVRQKAARRPARRLRSAGRAADRPPPTCSAAAYRPIARPVPPSRGRPVDRCRRLRGSGHGDRTLAALGGKKRLFCRNDRSAARPKAPTIHRGSRTGDCKRRAAGPPEESSDPPRTRDRGGRPAPDSAGAGRSLGRGIEERAVLPRTGTRKIVRSPAPAPASGSNPLVLFADCRRVGRLPEPSPQLTAPRLADQTLSLQLPQGSTSRRRRVLPMKVTVTATRSLVALALLLAALLVATAAGQAARQGSPVGQFRRRCSADVRRRTATASSTTSRPASPGSPTTRRSTCSSQLDASATASRVGDLSSARRRLLDRQALRHRRRVRRQGDEGPGASARAHARRSRTSSSTARCTR